MARANPGEVWIVDLGLAAKVRSCLVLGDYPREDELSLVIIVPHTTAVRNNRSRGVDPEDVLEGRLVVVYPLREAVPRLVLSFLPLEHRLAHLLPETLVRLGPPGKRHHGEPARQKSLPAQVIEGGYQLAVGQVARRPEDDHHVRLGRLLQAQPFFQRVLYFCHVISPYYAIRGGFLRGLCSPYNPLRISS